MPKRARDDLVAALLSAQNHRCHLCARAIEPDDAVDVDHKHRLADGGADEFPNKCVLCVSCHRTKTRRENEMHADRASLTSTEINEAFRARQSQAQRQNHRQWSLKQIRGWWQDRALVNAPYNRIPVWDATKRRLFVQTVMDGGVAPPLYVNHLRDTAVREVYDGSNRLNAVFEFMDGKSHAMLQHGRRTLAITYGPCRVLGCRAQCAQMDVVARRMFENRMIDMFEWDNLSTEEACVIAQHLNEGTPMNMGEKLRLLCGRGTPRARALQYLLDSDDWSTIGSRERDREKDRKILALLLRKLVCPEMAFSSHLTSNFTALENFYTSTAIVDARVLERGSAILARARELLVEREKSTRNVLLCLLCLVRGDKCDVESALCDANPDDDDLLTVDQLVDRWTDVE